MSTVTFEERETAKRLLEVVTQLEQERRKLPTIGMCTCDLDSLCAWHSTIDNDLVHAIKLLKRASCGLVAEGV